jgi:hypothetical protein
LLGELQFSRPASGGCRFEYTRWTIFGLHLALHEPVRFHAEKFDTSIHHTPKSSRGAESMEELVAAHKDVMADRVPQIVQFGSGALMTDEAYFELTRAAELAECLGEHRLSVPRSSRVEV